MPLEHVKYRVCQGDDSKRDYANLDVCLKNQSHHFMGSVKCNRKNMSSESQMGPPPPLSALSDLGQVI